MSALATGVRAALRHRRLAAVLWLSLLACASIALSPLRALFRPLDAGAFREALVKGWDGWAFLSFFPEDGRAIPAVLAAAVAALVAFALVTIYLTGGTLRALIVDRPRPVFRLVVAESAGLFKANLWATARFALTAGIWIALLAALPHWAIGRAFRDTAPPHTFWPELAFWWSLVMGALVLLNTGLRYDLARVALARGEAVNARGAYRVAERRLRGSRPSAIVLALVWIAIGVAVQALFTSAGVRWNSQTNGATFRLFVFRQFGFFVLAMARVGWWASLLEWENRRRP